MKTKNKELRFNGWKWAFFLLVFLLLFISARTYLYLESFSQPIQTGQVNEQLIESQQDRHLQVQASFDELEGFVNDYFSQMDVEGLQLHLDLSSGYELEGSIEVIGLQLPFRVSFQPQVLDNGNVIGKINDIEFLNFSLPVTQLMNIIHQLGDWPAWLVMDSDQQEIALNFNEIQWPLDGLQLNVQDISEEDRTLTFNLYLSPAFIDQELFDQGG